MGQTSYFLISVSNKINLDLCIKHALAGFTNSINGLWTFLDISEGDYISFLYGAKAHNLYKVEHKEAIKNAQDAPPWPPVKFKQSGKTYYFPFRVQLAPVRRFEESLVRPEFRYVAENLLLRGGYYKTHFQADQTTLQSVSQMGVLWDTQIDKITFPNKVTFIPRFWKGRTDYSGGEVWRFQELILQAVLRRYLSHADNLQELLNIVGAKIPADKMEVLGEKAIPEGHIDILIKEAFPTGLSRKIIVEVKAGTASLKDVHQLEAYIQEIGQECLCGILFAKNASKKVIAQAVSKNIKIATYSLGRHAEMTSPIAFDEIIRNLGLTFA
jgi:hypothetical protein